MTIDASSSQRILQMPPQQPREVQGDREPDGDADDVRKVAQKTTPASQIQDTKVGNKIDVLA